MSAHFEPTSSQSLAGDAWLEDIRADRFRFLCPECGGSVFTIGSDVLCPSEGRRFTGTNGILRLLSTERARELAPFLDRYRTVRRREGWGGSAAYYLGLPFHDDSGRHCSVWKLRARSFRAALRAIERHFQDVKKADEWDKKALRILELGAGNAWFSWRMAESGHFVLATDISLDEEDGLGALARYAQNSFSFRHRLIRAQAEMEHLPLEDGQFDLVVANGSLHYAARPARAVLEAERVLRRGGLLLVLDTPTYDAEQAGRVMVERRRREHESRHGLVSEDRGSGFLVHDDFVALLTSSDFAVRVVLPFEGLSRSLRRLYCGMRRLPPPARFPLFTAEKR